jgi:hypothetical protein
LFPQVICMRVPAHLQSAFVFLSHLPGGENQICPSDCDAIQKSTGEMVLGIDPDFANCRTKAVQSLLVKLFANAKSENSVPSFDVHGKFVRVDMLPSRSFATDFTGLPEWMPLEEKEVPKLVRRNKAGFVQIHVDIFSSRGHDNDDDDDGDDNQVEGIVDHLRRHIAENLILTGNFAKDNYFTLENGKISKEVLANPTLMNASISNTDSASFLVEQRQLYVSPRLLNRVTTILVKERQSAARTFVEKCLCQDMTDFKSVMYFDRERVYETQHESDAIGFVSVADVTQRLQGGNLPKWEAHWQNTTTSNQQINVDVYTEVLSNITVKPTANNKYTYSPGHCQTNLALKRLYATNRINNMIKKTSATTQDRKERKDLFTTALHRDLKSWGKDVKELYHPLICNDKQLAREVYPTKDHVCNLPNRKRGQEELDLSSSPKRVCSGETREGFMI